MRGAAAGALAAAGWQACDPLLERVFHTPYADAKLIGPFFTRGRLEWLANLAAHATAGAGFGYCFERFGGRGVKQGVAAALAENALLWPGLAVFDRIHPSRRDGTWGPLVSSPRVFASASAGHAIFGVLLGLLTARPRRPRTLVRVPTGVTSFQGFTDAVRATVARVRGRAVSVAAVDLSGNLVQAAKARLR